MRSPKAFLCSALFIALATIVAWAPLAWCAGPDWVLVDENFESRFFYDQSDKNKPAKGIVRVTTRVVYTAEGKGDALEILGTDKKFQKLFESRYLYDMDCKKIKTKLLEVSHLDKEGVVLKTTDLAAATEWEDMPPDTRMALVAEKVCPK
jgi:hypothetical protein